MPNDLDASFRAVAAAFDRGQSPKRLAADISAFGECVSASTDEAISAWLDALRARPRHIAILGGMYEQWIAALIERQESDFVHFAKIVDANIDTDDEQVMEAAMTAACDDANPTGSVENDPCMEMIVYAEPCARAYWVEVRVYARALNGTMVWSRVRCERSHPVAMAIYLDSCCERVRFEAREPPSLGKPGPLDRYHPERFATWHQSVRGLVSFARADNGRRATGVTLDDLNHVSGVVVADYNKLIRELPHETIRQLPKLGSAPLSQAIGLAAKNVIWMAAGRQIFDLPPSLIERFRVTDVDDVPLSLLRSPYPMIYLYFGPQADLQLLPGWQVDGAYVSLHQDVLMEVTVTAAPPEPKELAWWPIKGEPYAYQGFEARHLGMDVGTAVDEVLAADLARLREQAAASKVDIDAMLREMVDRGDVDPWSVPAHVEDVSALTASQEIARLVAQHVCYKSALRLVINALCYLTSYPGDIDLEYPAAAPTDLVQRTRSQDFKTAKRARDQLAKLGFVPIHICGRELQAAQVTLGDVATDRHVRPHWRRGHWRRQPYGEKRALRKLVWIMPVVVHPGQGDEVQGHVYVVD